MPRDAAQDAFLDAVGDLGAPLLSLLTGFERLGRRLHPPAIDELRSAFAPLVERAETALAAFGAAPVPEGFEGFADALAGSARIATRAGRGVDETP